MECIAADLVRPSGTTGPQPAGTTDDQPSVSFHDVLSALNPLQYLPVVGSIYRAVTGDIPPEPVRIAGSFVVSGLMGGPIGLAISAVVTGAEKLAGIDPDHLVHEVLAEVGVVDGDAPAEVASVSTQGEAVATAYARVAQLGLEGR